MRRAILTNRGRGAAIILPSPPLRAIADCTIGRGWVLDQPRRAAGARRCRVRRPIVGGGRCQRCQRCQRSGEGEGVPAGGLPITGGGDAEEAAGGRRAWQEPPGPGAEEGGVVEGGQGGVAAARPGPAGPPAAQRPGRYLRGAGRGVSGLPGGEAGAAGRATGYGPRQNSSAIQMALCRPGSGAAAGQRAGRGMAVPPRGGLWRGASVRAGASVRGRGKDAAGST